jgi:nitroreductase
VTTTDNDDALAADGPWVDRLATPRVEPARDGVAPDEDALARILETATTVPDHGGLRPWRFALITGAGRERFGAALVAGLHSLRGEDLLEPMVTKMQGKAFAAPCAVMLIASPDPSSNVPVWEQVASASCTGYAMVLAATALGLGAAWKSAPVLATEPVRTLFAAREDEQLLGWINLGTPGPSRERATTADGPVDLAELVTVISSDDRPFGR